MKRWESLSIKQILNETGDKYSYVINNYLKQQSRGDEDMSVALEQVMDQVYNNIADCSMEEQFLLSTCVKNMLNGSHWGFIEKEVLKAFKEPLKYNNALTRVGVVGKGKEQRYFVEATDPRKALQILKKVAPSLVDQDFLNKYLHKLTETRKAFESFVKKSYEGKGFIGYIGVNSINSTNTMTYKGKRHKAFQLPLKDVVTVLVSVLGRNVVVGISGQTKPLPELLTAYKSPFDLMRDLEVSEGSTSIVLPLAIKGNR
jgi:hypothetical protein